MASNCLFLNCAGAVKARGLCTMHYQREVKSGALASRPYLPRRSSATDGPEGRACKDCGETKPLDAFVKNARMHRGRTLDCKACRNEKVKAWKAVNAARATRHRADYRKAHPEVDERASRARRARVAGAVSDGLVTRDSLRDRDGGLCAYCGVAMDFGKWSPGNRVAATVDHVVPLVAGGSDTLGNTVLACLSCNARKGGRLHEGVLQGAP